MAPRKSPVNNSTYPTLMVDLSHWNSVTNFTDVKKAGILSVIHKATEGSDYVDKEYKARRKLAEDAGLLWGAYHFGTNTKNGTFQADFFLDTIGNTTGVLFALDIEPSKRPMSVAAATLFVERVFERTGRYPLMYGSSSHLEPYQGTALDSCSLWIASYTSGPEPLIPSHRDDWLFWQYTNGTLGGNPKSVDGIGNCDIDRFKWDVNQLKDLWPDL